MATAERLDDTIFAMATASGRAGVAVLRVSGANAASVLKKLCRPYSPPSPRTATMREIVDPASGEKIDRAIVLWFPAPHSFTGEDVVELHLHGGRAVINAVTECLNAFPNFRIAEAGEFTRRAFENGKMDLTEAEAIADLVDAETAAQRRQALRQLEGDLGKLYNNWSERLKNALAYMEAEIDFSDEELPEDFTKQKLEDVKKLLEEIDHHLDDKHRGERLREGFSVAIIGAPNAGKSSLLNALARREAAIVASTPGTTRDVIEVQLDLGGYPFLLADTAGLRETKDEIEREGVRRANARASQADLKLLVFDGEDWPNINEATQAFVDNDTISIVTKSDLYKHNAAPKITAKQDFIFISTVTGEGLSDLTAKLIHAVDTRFAGTGQPSLTRARHRAALEDSRQHLCRALSVSQSELRAEDIRLAMRSLGRITGRVGVEDLLDIIFRDFCVGK